MNGCTQPHVEAVSKSESHTTASNPHRPLIPTNTAKKVRRTNNNPQKRKLDKSIDSNNNKSPQSKKRKINESIKHIFDENKQLKQVKQQRDKYKNMSKHYYNQMQLYKGKYEKMLSILQECGVLSNTSNNNNISIENNNINQSQNVTNKHQINSRNENNENNEMEIDIITSNKENINTQNTQELNINQHDKNDELCMNNMSNINNWECGQCSRDYCSQTQKSHECESCEQTICSDCIERICCCDHQWTHEECIGTLDSNIFSNDLGYCDYCKDIVCWICDYNEPKKYKCNNCMEEYEYKTICGDCQNDNEICCEWCYKEINGVQFVDEDDAGEKSDDEESEAEGEDDYESEEESEEEDD